MAQMAVAAGVDWLEAGTPLMLAEGARRSRPCARVPRDIRSSPT